MYIKMCDEIRNNSRLELLLLAMFRRSFYGLYPYKSSMIGLESLADPSADWDIVETIGKGTYGKVYKVINKKDGSQAAVKVLDPINVIDGLVFCVIYCHSFFFLM